MFTASWVNTCGGLGATPSRKISGIVQLEKGPSRQLTWHSCNKWLKRTLDKDLSRPQHSARVNNAKRWKLRFPLYDTINIYLMDSFACPECFGLCDFIPKCILWFFNIRKSYASLWTWSRSQITLILCCVFDLFVFTFTYLSSFSHNMRYIFFVLLILKVTGLPFVFIFFLFLMSSLRENDSVVYIFYFILPIHMYSLLKGKCFSHEKSYRYFFI